MFAKKKQEVSRQKDSIVSVEKTSDTIKGPNYTVTRESGQVERHYTHPDEQLKGGSIEDKALCCECHGCFFCCDTVSYACSASVCTVM